MRRLALAAFAFAALAPTARLARATEAYRELSLDEVAKLVEGHGAAVYDADPPDLYAKAHVPGARLVSYKRIDTSVLPGDKGTTLVFYCHNRL